MWTLKITTVLGKNYESSVESTFTGEVKFGLLFAQTQKIMHENC